MRVGWRGHREVLSFATKMVPSPNPVRTGVWGSVHTYPGLFENEAFRPRIHRNGHTYPHVSGAFWNARAPKRSFSKTLPKVDLSKTEVSDRDLFCVWTWYPDLFCHCFQGDQKWRAQAMNIASRAFAVSLPKPVAAHFFLFRRELPSNTKRRMVVVVFRSNSTSSPSSTKVRCFVFISVLLRLLFVFHFAFGAFLLSPASMAMIRKLRTLLPRGTSTWSNTEEQHWQAKETNKKSVIWARGESVHRGCDFQVEARFLGSIHVRVNGVSGLTYDTCGHPKTDLFENGSFWKRICVHVA